MSLQQIKRRNPRCRISAVTIDPIDPTCFIMFRIIPEDRAAQGEISKRGDERAVRRLPRVIAIIVTGPAAGVTTSAEPANGRTKQN